MESQIQNLINELSGAAGQAALLTRQRDEARVLVQTLTAKLERVAKVQSILQTVAQTTQDRLRFEVSELVSLALASAFPGRYYFQLVFEARRGQSEARFSLLDEKGNEVDPMDSTGGGVVDMAAFALRVCFWGLRYPRTRPTILLDEPFRFVSRDRQLNLGGLLHELSTRLGIQFVIVTHEEALVEAADRVFHVSRDGAESKVRFDGQTTPTIRRRRTAQC